MSDLTRRGFVKTSAGTAAGVVAVSGLLAAEAQARSSQPVLAFVRDPRSGEISVMTGDREVTVRDKKLAAQIVRAAG